MTLRVHCLQHAAFEPPGTIADWAAARGHAFHRHALYDGALLPKIADFDLLVLMGGPMSINDEAKFAWLTAERALVREAIAAGKKVFGVCLGAQLIAGALGARVAPMGHREIGWFKIHATGAPAPFTLPREMLVLHWHGETFDLPKSATLLATSEACRHQAFCVGQSCIGLQFHLEATPALVAGMLEHCAAEVKPGTWVQSAKEIKGKPEFFERTRSVLYSVLDSLR